MSDRPNILVIMSDEHDPAVTGCYGDRVVQTPMLDRLAAGGIAFDAAYTTSPLCVPARLSFTAGKYASRCGAWSNSCRLPSENYPSLPRLLESTGYESYLCGKMHYAPDRRYGWRDLIPDDPCNNYTKDGRGGRRDPHSTQHNERSWRGRTAEFFIGDENDSKVMRHDMRRTETAIDFLQSRPAEAKPFCLLMGLLSPHFPLIAPQSYYDAVKGRVPMPDLPADWWERLPTNCKATFHGFGIDRDDIETTRRGRELYWALIGWMDAQIGRILNALAASPHADNTVVVYTSDHGENKGDHGQWWKNNMYEHSARVPLIVSWPARWAGGHRRSGACSLVDVVQTVAELAGAQTPGDWDGRSLLPYLDDEAAGCRDLAVSEYYAHNIASGFVMLRQGEWKYVYHTRFIDGSGPERELYHLPTDPGEWSNLARDSAQAERIATMHAALVTELGRDPEEAEAECREQYARGYDAPSTLRVGV